MTAPLVADLLQPLESLWKEAGKTAHAPVLRLSLLRAAARNLHHAKSIQLATGEPEVATELHATEQLLDKLVTQEKLDGSIAEWLRRAESMPEVESSKSVLPPALAEALPSEKIERYDRKWERGLVRLAIQASWHLWQVDVNVRIPEAQASEVALEKALWPQGVVLFADSGDLAEPGTGLWKGRWLVLASPLWSPPDEFTVTGWETEPKPEWHQLHPRRSRARR